MDISEILEIFKSDYPSLDPLEIYDKEGGYLVVAPQHNRQRDPYYVVDITTRRAYPYIMKSPKEFFEIMNSGPMWAAMND